jgi:deoxyuridine 5'-triphosphate nucleotidohydrolase
MVETDASDYAIGGVLNQRQEDGKWHPVAFLSQSLDSAQRNYDVHDKELHAIIAALEEWRHYLIQSPHPVEVLTDHANLLYFKTKQKLNRRQARWATDMEEYRLQLRHRPGKASGKPDALSRRAGYDQGKEDNKDRVLLPEEWFINSLDGSGKDILLTDQIIQEQLKDPIIRDILTKLESESVRGWTGNDGLWRYNGKIYVPSSLRRIVFTTLHSAPTAGHQGIKPTIDLVTRYYYWPELKRDVTSWVTQCDLCQKNKNFPSKKSGKLQPNEIPTRPWEIVSMDFLTGLPESEGYDAILVVVDRFSKMIRLIRCTKQVNAYALARLCWDNVWKDFGLPCKILSDRGPQFASNFIKAHNEMLGITTALSTSYHPQTDGQSERMIQEVQKTLRMYVNHFQNDWSSKLSLVEFASNNAIKSSTGYTPFYLVSGQHPNPGNIPKDLSSRCPSAEEFVEGLREAREQAHLSLSKAAEQMKKFADRNRKEAPSFSIGDKVLLDSSNYPTERPSRKLTERRFGPFKIIEKLSDLNYRLELPDTWKLPTNVFHVDQLRKYHEDPDHPNFTNPPPELVKENPEYEVEEILDAEFRQQKGSKKRTLHFLVKWVGYHSKDNTWEPYVHVENSPAALADFYKANPNKPKPEDKVPPPSQKPRRGTRRRVRFLGTDRVSVIDDTSFVPLENSTDVTSWPSGPITNSEIFVVDELQVLLHSSKAKLPTRGTELAAGYDLSSAQDLVIPSRGQALVRTDISLAVPAGTYGRIAPRSSLALKHGIDVGAGVIDADYTGHVGVVLLNHGPNDFTIKIGDRIAQLILERILTPKVVKVQNLDNTKRGTSGFGSTGV